MEEINRSWSFDDIQRANALISFREAVNQALLPKK